MKKRLLPALLALCMVLSLLPRTAFAAADESESASEPAALAENASTTQADIEASGECGEGVTWTLDSGGVLTIAGNGATQDYSILQWASDTKPFLTDAPWCIYYDSIVSVRVEDGVSRLGEDAFFNAPNLKTVILANSVITLGNDAFRGCGSLTSITLSDQLTDIPYQCFLGDSKLRELSVPKSVQRIDGEALVGCRGLEKITIYNAATKLGSFRDCSSLVTIDYYGTKEQWETICRGVSFATEPTVNYLGSEPQGFIDFGECGANGSNLTAIKTGKATITVTMKDGGSKATCTVTVLGGFTDVKPNAYYANAVAWAVKGGITNGTGMAYRPYSYGQVCIEAVSKSRFHLPGKTVPYG